MAKKKRRPMRKTMNAPKTCYFCDEQKLPWFSDVESLKRFTTERGKLIGRTKNGLCAKHQDNLTDAVKHARHVALLPFIVKG